MYQIIKWHVVVSATVNESLLFSRIILDNQSGKETDQVKDQLAKSLKNGSIFIRDTLFSFSRKDAHEIHSLFLEDKFDLDRVPPPF